MRAPGSGTATTNNKPPSFLGSRRSSPCHSTVSSSTEGKPRSVVELRKKPSAGSVLVATTTNRSTKITTTKTTTLVSAHHPSTTTSSKTATTTTRPARPTISPSLSSTVTRTPLRPRDKNAGPARPLGPLRSSLSAAMSVNNKPPRQVQMPTLSAQAARALNKTPLTPKIATRGTLSTPTSQSQTAAMVTPLARRGQQRSDPIPNSTGRDDVASPVPVFLASSITPRSGSRQSRVDTSASSTPTGTPNPESHDAWEMRSGLGISPTPVSNQENMRRPVVTFGSALDTNTRQDKDSKFFYASEAAKSTPPPPPQQPRQQQQKADTFFYANGAALPETRQGATPTASTPVDPPVQQDHLMSKFVYANGIRDTPPASRPSIASRVSGSVVSTASKAPVPRLGTPTTAGNTAGYGQQRPLSPVKLSSYSSVKNSSNPSLPMSRTNSGLGTVPSLGPAAGTQKRRSVGNADSSRPPSARGGHSRHGSVTTIPEVQAPTVARLIPSTNPSYASSTASSPSNISNPGSTAPLPTTTAGGFASLLQATEDLTITEPTTAENDSAAASSLQSPTKTSSQDQALTELVANARRERKVQDLEITNASLEAINRTLERQMRKQTAELRRYRRLSRSGRLSLNSVASHPGEGRGGRIASDGSIAGGALARAGLSLEDLSEEEDSDAEAEDMAEMDDDEDEDEDDFSASESGEMSPGARALRDAKHRRRDEQRLQLDLSKHQQLLVDSQKMNQSLRRCLGWTEELIKEGRRALAYKVHVSEVELGGRVLAPEEVEAREREDSHLDDEEMEMVHHAVRFDLEGAASEEIWTKGSQDRDSGIDLPTDGG